MSDVVVTSGDDATESVADTLAVTAVAESARQNALAESAAIQAQQASVGTEVNAEVATEAASVSADSAEQATSAASVASDASAATLAAVSSLAGLVEQLRADLAEVKAAKTQINDQPVVTPAPASEDTAPKKSPIIARKWGRRS